MTNPSANDRPMQTTAATLAYEVPFSRQRLDDGSIRITIVVDRKHYVHLALLLVVISATALVLMARFGPPEAKLEVELVTGISGGIWLIMLIAALFFSRQHTTTFDVGAFGIRANTTASGDPIRVNIPVPQLRVVRGESGGLVIVSDRGEHPFLQLAPNAKIIEATDALREALAEFAPNVPVNWVGRR